MTQIAKFNITVSYDRSIRDLVHDDPENFDYDNIAYKAFSTDRHGEIQLEAIIVDFERPILSDEVVHEIDEMGLRLGEIHELLAFAKQHPDIQKEYVIAALGSKFGPKSNCVPMLKSCWRYPDKRELHLRPWDGYYTNHEHWGDRCRFLAFCK